MRGRVMRVGMMRQVAVAVIVWSVVAATGSAQTPGTPSAGRDTTRTTPVSVPADTVRQDTVRRDTVSTKSGRDTTVVPTDHRPAKDTTKPRADSIQARIGRDHGPLSLEIGDAYTFTRDQYFATGAFMLTEILERLPGVLPIQSGWLQSSQAVAYNGDLGRLRVFYDGVEMDELEGRQNGIVDLSAIPAWSLDRMTITRGANELRIDLRSWEYTNVRPYTQFDVYEGDLNTTVYRGFYAKRFYNGTGLQFAGERFNVNDTRLGASGDRTGIFARYGIGRPIWSLDATLVRTGGHRSLEKQYLAFDAIAPYTASNSMIYLRGAWGREGSGPFVQFVGASRVLKEYSTHFDVNTAGSYGFPSDTADTTTSMAQYVITAGFDKWGGRVRLTDRYRVGNHQHFNAPSASFDYATSILSVSASAEHDTYQGFTRLEVDGRIQPVPFFAVSGAIGTRNADADRTVQPSSRSARLEAGVRLNNLWVLGGVITRDTSFLNAPTMFDSAFRNFPTGRTTGTTMAVRGPVLWGFSLDAQGTHWRRGTPYAPQYEFVGELKYFTQWLSKFPRKDFSFTFAPRLEYRDAVIFPGSTGDAPPSTVYSLMVQIRIMRGVAYIERRNLAGILYEQVPGYLMPRGVTAYGVRWYFFD